MLWMIVYVLGLVLTWLFLRRLHPIRIRLLYASLLWPLVWPLAIILYVVRGREEIERRYREMSEGDK